jgi:hypothetical protein
MEESAACCLRRAFSSAVRLLSLCIRSRIAKLFSLIPILIITYHYVTYHLRFMLHVSHFTRFISTGYAGRGQGRLWDNGLTLLLIKDAVWIY